MCYCPCKGRNTLDLNLKDLSMSLNFPGTHWESKDPQELGFSSEKLSNLKRWMIEVAQGHKFRVVIARYGYLVVEWSQGIEAEARVQQASASKSFYSGLLGIAVEDGVISDLDATVVDYYPEMMDIKAGLGPKEGRYAFDKDRAITFQQLIGNTSGYMKPDEEPGKKFHYQTFGMNILTNSLGTVYGLYDSKDPDRLPGAGHLVEKKLRDPIGGTWCYGYRDFKHDAGAMKNIFGHSLNIWCTALDAARIGHLWLNKGNWDGIQVIPYDYMCTATTTNQDIMANEPERRWRYGLGFWVNDYGKQWPALSRDSFAAWGAGAKHIWVDPSLELVVALNPAPWTDVLQERKRLRFEQEALMQIVEAIVD